MTQPVRVARAAGLAGAVISIYVIVLFVVRPVPPPLIAMLGGPSGLAYSGGARVRYVPPPGISAEEVLRRLPSAHGAGGAGGELLLELPGVARGSDDELTDTLVSGGFAMHVVVDGVEPSTQLFRLIGEERFRGVDSWRDEQGRQYRDYYAQARSREELLEVIARATDAGWQLPAELAVAFERVPLRERSGRTEGDPWMWRTYLVRAAPALAHDAIERARTASDPNTGRPIVLLDFTPEGGRRFCEVTREITGHKLATIVGGRVRSAPIILSEICGGGATVTMGGGDLEEQQSAAAAFVAAVQHPPLPPGGSIARIEYVDAAERSTHEWLGRLVLGLAAGLGLGLITALVLCVVRPRRAPAPAVAPGGFPYRRAAVTLLAPAALLLGRQLRLPGLDGEIVEGIAASGQLGAELFSLGVAGVTPVLTAFVLVEVVALAVPALRWRRHDPRGRPALGRATVCVAAVAGFAQGYFMASHLAQLQVVQPVIGIDPGLVFHVLIGATVATTALLLAGVAGVISEHGLGNGYAALMLSAVVITAVDNSLHPAVDRASAALGIVELCAIAALTAGMVRWRIGGDGAGAGSLRVPVTGVSPLHEAGGLAVVLAALVAVGLGPALAAPVEWLAALQHASVPELGLVLALALGAGWLFARPSLVPGTTEAMWWRAVIASAGLMLVAFALAYVARGASPSLDAVIASPAGAALAGAALVDLWADARARRGGVVLAPVAVLHQIQRAALAERVLAEAGIRCHVHAGAYRTLLAFFGPWAPAIVLVPEDRAAEARQLLDQASINSVRALLNPSGSGS